MRELCWFSVDREVDVQSAEVVLVKNLGNTGMDGEEFRDLHLDVEDDTDVADVAQNLKMLSHEGYVEREVVDRLHEKRVRPIPGRKFYFRKKENNFLVRILRTPAGVRGVVQGRMKNEEKSKMKKLKEKLQN